MLAQVALWHAGYGEGMLPQAALCLVLEGFAHQTMVSATVVLYALPPSSSGRDDAMEGKTSCLSCYSANGCRHHGG